MNKSLPRWLEKLGFLGIGAIAGAAFALIIERTGHPWWALLIFLSGALSPALLRGAINFRASLQRGRTLFVLAMIAASLTSFLAVGINPREYGYAPLLPPVLLAALLFGFGQALFAAVVCTVAADYFFAPPVFEFALINIEDAVGLSVFAVLGAFVALMVHIVVPRDEA